MCSGITLGVTFWLVTVAVQDVFRHNTWCHFLGRHSCCPGCVQASHLVSLSGSSQLLSRMCSGITLGVTFWVVTVAVQDVFRHHTWCHFLARHSCCPGCVQASHLVSLSGSSQLLSRMCSGIILGVTFWLVTV